MGIMLITHDLGVVAEVADDVAVMYLGRVAERAALMTSFMTRNIRTALLHFIPKLEVHRQERLDSIHGWCLIHSIAPAAVPFTHVAMPPFQDAVTTIVPHASTSAQIGTVSCLLYSEEDLRCLRCLASLKPA